MCVVSKHGDPKDARILIKRMDDCIEITHINHVKAGQHTMFLPGMGIGSVTELNRRAPEYTKLKCRFEEGEHKCNIFTRRAPICEYVLHDYDTDSYRCDVINIEDLDAYLSARDIDDSLLGPLRTLPWYYELLACHSKPNVDTYGTVVYKTTLAAQCVIPLLSETSARSDGLQKYDQSLLFEGFDAAFIERVQKAIAQTFKLNEFIPCNNLGNAIHALESMTGGGALRANDFDFFAGRMQKSVVSVSPGSGFQYVAATKVGKDHMFKFSIESSVNACLVV